MKSLKNLIKTALVAGAVSLANVFYTPNKSFSQDASQMQTSEKKLFPNLNFYFETEGYANYNYSGSKKHVMAWLSKAPKEDKRGMIWFYYGDTDDDGVYDYVSVQNNSSQIKSQEKFSFNFDTKKIDYVLEVYDPCQESINNCDKIISKSYNNINQKEAEQLGDGFFERIKEFATVQEEFSRFNSGQLEDLVRKEASYTLKIDNGKLAGNSRIPIEKFLSKEEIKKVENYIREKPERERIEKEQEETRKIEYEKQEKIRLEQEKIKRGRIEIERLEKEKIEKEQEETRKIEYEKQEKIRLEQEEARKPKVRLKVGGSIGKAFRYDKNLFFEINPSIRYGNGKKIKNKIGLDLMYGSLKFDEYNGGKIKYNTFGIGFNSGIIFPEIEYDYLNIRVYPGRNLSYSFSQKLEFFPSQDPLKNLSFSLEPGIFHGNYVGVSLEGRFGIKYTFRK